MAFPNPLRSDRAPPSVSVGQTRLTKRRDPRRRGKPSKAKSDAKFAARKAALSNGTTEDDGDSRVPGIVPPAVGRNGRGGSAQDGESGGTAAAAAAAAAAVAPVVPNDGATGTQSGNPGSQQVLSLDDSCCF